jgi:hypothetical protein
LKEDFEMSELYSVAQVVEMLGLRNQQPHLYQRAYQRAYQAVCLGYAGQVRRMGRGFVLTEKNVEKVTAYLRKRWPEYVPASVSEETLAVEL